MNITLNKLIVEETIKKYGADNETTVAMEECAELIQAVSKMKRGSGSIDHLAEEIADVFISMEILRQAYGIKTQEVYKWVLAKQERMWKRLAEEGQP